nr:ISL3 family transposase [Gordonia humi]
MLLGLEGVEVVGVSVGGPDGRTRIVDVGTSDPAASCCPGCGVRSTSVKERVVCTPRDIGYGDAPIMVRWNKIRWRCVNSECARGSFTEAIGQVPRRRRTTTRLRETIGRAIGDAARSVAEVAAGHGVSWHTAHGAFVDIAATALTDPAPTSVLGIDETRRGKPRWVRGGDGRWVRIDPWDTGFVDLAGDQGLLGQVTGRTSAVVIDWLAAQPAPFRDAIEYVAIDPAASYAAAVAVALPNAQLVVDHFHLVQLANAMVTKVRRRVTWDRRGRRGRSTDPEWANRRRLLMGRERLSDNKYQKMIADLRAHDPGNEIFAAYIVKEELRALLAMARSRPRVDDSQIRERLYRFLDLCAQVNVPEANTLARTIETWWPGICAFIRTQVTNAATEGTMKRPGFSSESDEGESETCLRSSVRRPATARYGWSTTVRPWKGAREQSRSALWRRSWGSVWKPCGSGATVTVRPTHTPTRRSRSSRRIADFAANWPNHAERTRS